MAFVGEDGGLSIAVMLHHLPAVGFLLTMLASILPLFLHGVAVGTLEADGGCRSRSSDTIPFDLIPYHQGCLESFLLNMKNISTACNTCPLGSIFCGQVLQLLAVILSYKWRL